MQKKRIVKETLADGTIQYRVNLEAVFDTLEEAEEHAFGYSKS